MNFRVVVLGLCIAAYGCSGVKSVQLRPPIASPHGLVFGYGVEKFRGNAVQALRSAKSKALDELLSRGSVSATLEPVFKREAVRDFQPPFGQEGIKDGFAWVLLGASQDAIYQRWKEFLTSDTDFESILKTEEQERELRRAIDSGQLALADRLLDEALQDGFDPQREQGLRMEIIDLRKLAVNEMLSGDEFFRDEQYRQAIDKYQAAQRIDRDNTQLPNKIAMAEDQYRLVRMDSASVTATAIQIGGRLLEGYLNHRREDERRKQEEAEQEERRPRRRSRP